MEGAGKKEGMEDKGGVREGGETRDEEGRAMYDEK